MNSNFKTRLIWLIVVLTNLVNVGVIKAQKSKPIEIETKYLKYDIGNACSSLNFTDKRTGKDYKKHASFPFAKLTVAGKDYDASAVSYDNGRLTVEFGKAAVTAVIEVKTEKHYFTLEVLSISDINNIEKLTFIDIPLTCQGTLEDKFQCCALALNLQTIITEVPGPSSRLTAMCYSKVGLIGAKVAIIGCPKGELRNIMKEVVSAAKDIPHSKLGGPWALDAEINRGSYLISWFSKDFSTEVLNEDSVDSWIELARSMGIKQLDFHMGHIMRFGDYEPNLEVYPRGIESVKAVINKLHAAGIKAGLHIYGRYFSKESRWVTPVPDKGLAKDGTFDLAQAITADANVVPEVTKGISFIDSISHIEANSITIQIDDELITLDNISKEKPSAARGFKRGAYGTKIAAHEKGAKIYKLAEIMNLFWPDPNSPLLMAVADRIADIYNQCGFDMIYCDAMGDSWPSDTKFLFELYNRLDKTPLIELNPITAHHFWYVRSRMWSWDCPSRAAKRFVDIHTIANREGEREFLPTHLGWWAVFDPNGGIQPDRTFPDDIEYLCGKALAHDSSLSFLVGFTPKAVSKSWNLQRLAAIIKNYEDLRLSNYFPESVRTKLAVPGDEFVLQQGRDKQWQLRPTQYAKHKIETVDERSTSWTTKNKFGRQPVQLRIEALLSAASYDAPGNITLADFNTTTDFTEHRSQKEVLGTLKIDPPQNKIGPSSLGRFSAESSYPHQDASWTMFGKKFTPPLKMNDHVLGVWINGDGKGEVLNFQIKSAATYSDGIHERYVTVDFTGWRYFELVEPEGDKIINFEWPYSIRQADWNNKSLTELSWYVYPVYFYWLDYNQIESFSVWYNNIPPGTKVSCVLSPVKAIPVKKIMIKNPSVTIGDKTIVFPIEFESGCYLEFHSINDCKLYGPKGELICDVKPQGDVPVIKAGENQIKFNCNVDSGMRARANVTVITQSNTVLGK